jgi:hypothetical protein
LARRLAWSRRKGSRLAACRRRAAAGLILTRKRLMSALHPSLDLAEPIESA